MKRSQTISFKLEQLKNPKFLPSIIKIQRSWRSIISRRHFLKAFKKLKRKNFTINQLVSSQRTYCSDLKLIIKKVLQPSKVAINDEELHQILFCNLTEIFMMHHVFLFQLQQKMSQYSTLYTCLSQPLVKLFMDQNFMPRYTEYCYNYTKADKIMKLLTDNNSKFKQILKQSQMINTAKNLQSYMIKPVQRLCKYQVMLKQYQKNLWVEHPDYQGIKKVIKIIQSLVEMTNSQVEEFLFKQRQKQLRFQFQQVFLSYQNKKSKEKLQNKQQTKQSKQKSEQKNENSGTVLMKASKLVYQFEKGTASLVHLIKQEESPLQIIAVFNEYLLIVPKASTDVKPAIITPLHIRKLQNMKYFKNLLQIVQNKKYYTLEFKQQSQRDTMYEALQKKTTYLLNHSPFSTVSILGTERRESFFKFYTVYIIQIQDDKNKPQRIYPRFKNLLKVQQILIKKNIFQELNVPLLQKQSPHLTMKSRTIEKRKFHIRQFIQRIVNNPKIIQLQQIRETLGYIGEKLEKKKKQVSKNQSQLSILLPNWQTINVHINAKSQKIKDLKHKISEQLEFIHSTQFELFEIRNRQYSTRRLLYDDESVLPLYEAQNELNINPFSDKLQFMYSRHYYLSPEEQLALYKIDFIRLQLELSVIKTEILSYSLTEQLMITFMCLFAMYINMPLQQQKITSLIKEIGRKSYKISAQDFKVYFKQVLKIVSGEEDETVTVPFLIIKILSNNRLYQSQQFQVEVHKKCFKQVQKQIGGIEEVIIMGIRLQNILLLTVKQKHLIKTVQFEDIESMQMHPNGIIFKLKCLQSVFRIKTTQGYQINRLITIYQQKRIVEREIQNYQ